MGLYSHKDYAFHLKKPVAEWKGLKDHEVKLLNGMFSDGETEDVGPRKLAQQVLYKTFPAFGTACSIRWSGTDISCIVRTTLAARGWHRIRHRSS